MEGEARPRLHIFAIGVLAFVIGGMFITAVRDGTWLRFLFLMSGCFFGSWFGTRNYKRRKALSASSRS